MVPTLGMDRPHIRSDTRQACTLVARLPRGRLLAPLLRREGSSQKFYRDTIAGVPGMLRYVFLSLITIIGVAVFSTVLVG